MDRDALSVLEHFDKMVCAALDIDQDSAKPLFILEALS